MREVVIDASVALTWVLPDEEDTALALLLAFQRRELDLTVPSVWEYEVANALWTGVLRERLTRNEAEAGWRFLLGLGAHLAAFAPLAERTWQIALEYGLTVYDAIYVALSEERQCELYTGDEQVLRAFRDSELVKWMDEFP